MDSPEKTIKIFKIVGYLSLLALIGVALYYISSPTIITASGNENDVAYQIKLNILLALSGVGIIPLVLFYNCLPVMFKWASYKLSIILLFLTGFTVLIAGYAIPRGGDGPITIGFLLGAIIYIVTAIITLNSVYLSRKRN